MKKALLTGVAAGMICCAMILGTEGKAADAATATTESAAPKITGHEKTIYLGGKDKITIQGKRIVSVKYTSSKPKIAAISKKGTVTPKKKGKTTIKATVVYRKSAGGKKYTKRLKYSLKVLGKAKEYFKVSKKGSAYTVTGLTNKGKKLTKVYIPGYIGKYAVTTIATGALQENAIMEELYFSDNLKETGLQAISNCSKLKKVSLGKSFKIKESNKGFLDGCNALEKIALDSRNSSLMLADGVLFSKSGKTLYRYPSKKAGESYTVPAETEKINGHAFEGCVNLKSITIPDNIAYISDYCFAGSGLTSMNFSDDVDYLGEGVFENCSALSEVRLSKRVVEISDYTFQNCTALKKMELPEAIYTISDKAFRGCSQLENYNVAATNKNFVTEDGVLYNKKKTKLILYPAGKKTTTYNVSEETLTIGRSAFYGCASLEHVVLPEKVSAIEGCAFMMSGLKDITLPDSVERIDGYLFSDCKNLSKVTLSAEISYIPSFAFLNCTALTEITLPKNIEGCVSNSFDGCTNLQAIYVDEENQYYDSADGVLFSKNLNALYLYPDGKTNKSYTIPKKVRYIEYHAFSGTVHLKNIYVLDNILDIDDYAFENCGSVEKIELPKTLNMKYRRRISFRNCKSLKKMQIPNFQKTIYKGDFEGCVSLEEVIVPDSVTEIENSAFRDCAKLNKITIGKNVSKIGAKAFDNCISMQRMTILSKKLNYRGVEKGAFRKTGANNYKKLVVKVPSGKKTLYKKLLRKAGLSVKAKVK